MSLSSASSEGGTGLLGRLGQLREVKDKLAGSLRIALGSLQSIRKQQKGVLAEDEGEVYVQVGRSCWHVPRDLRVGELAVPPGQHDVALQLRPAGWPSPAPFWCSRDLVGHPRDNNPGAAPLPAPQNCGCRHFKACPGASGYLWLMRMAHTWKT